jgi:hypothetical protein
MQRFALLIIINPKNGAIFFSLRKKKRRSYKFAFPYNLLDNFTFLENLTLLVTFIEYGIYFEENKYFFKYQIITQNLFFLKSILIAYNSKKNRLRKSSVNVLVL